MSTCPSDKTLRLIGTEAIGEDTFVDLEGHVEQCPDCQTRLEAALKTVPQATPLPPTRSAPPTLSGLVIDHELGRGGTSVVYLAWEEALTRHVAVKLFPKNSLVDPHARTHWLGEARAISRVPHKNVVAIHYVGESADWLYLVLEHVSGGTLKARLSEPLPPRDAARLMESIACAVGYFHTQGLTHLDLKPANILLEGAPGAPWECVRPKVSDFGIARLEGEPGATVTGANGPKGTPSYMAPEQVAALPGTIGPAADLHALGAILYHLLTGRPPFQGASNAETLDQVRTQDPVPPRRLNARIPRDLETIGLKCLEKAPRRRYPNAEALADDLRRWLDGRPITARRITPIGHAWRLCRRQPVIAGLLALLTLTLATGVVGLFVLLDQAEVERTRLAEARRHAEAYEQFSASTADQLGMFIRTSIRSKGVATLDQMVADLLTLRDSTRELKHRGIVPSATLGILEAEIGWSLNSFSKSEPAREILNQAITDLNQSAVKNPEDKDVQYYLGQVLFQAGCLAEEDGQLEAALDRFAQAAAIRMDCVPTKSKYLLLTVTYMRLQGLSDHLGQRGLSEQAKRSRHLSQQILSQLLGSDLASSTDAFPPGLSTLRRLFQRDELKKMASHQDKAIRYGYERFVAEWLACSVRPLSPFRSSASAASYDRDPEAGTLALISTLRQRCSKLGLEDSMVPATFPVVLDDAVAEAASLRKLHRIDDVRATVARLMVLARRLVREYPESTHSYRVLSEAYNQVKKNAYQTGDEKLVEETLVQAVEAARHALALDPDRLITRNHLAKITEQLDSVRAERKAAGSSLR